MRQFSLASEKFPRNCGLSQSLTPVALRTLHPTPREKIIAFRPDNDTFEAMASLRERGGVPFSEQIRRALRAWLQDKSVMKPVRKISRRRRQP